MECGEKIDPAHLAAVGVFFLRPRVGAEEVDARGEAEREEPSDRVVRIDPQDPDILRMRDDRFPAHLADAAEEPFDTEKVSLGKLFRHTGEERPVAATEIELNGSLSRKEILPLEAGEPVVGIDFVWKGKGLDLGHGRDFGADHAGGQCS